MNAIDTNILVYAVDSAYPEKKKVCEKLVSSIFEGKQMAAVTNQILAEFVWVATRKMQNPLSREDAALFVNAVMSSIYWKVLNYTGDTVCKALDSSVVFWDGLIIETLKENGVRGIITENTRDFSGQGIIVHNPFE